DEFSVLRKFRNAGDRAGRDLLVLAAVAFADEDVAVWGDQDVARFVQRGRWIARHAACAELEQDFAVRAELDDRVPQAFRVRKFLEFLRRGPALVGDPDVAVLVDVDAVGKEDLAGAEALEQLASLIELHDRVGSRPRAAVRAAPFADPDAL